MDLMYVLGITPAMFSAIVVSLVIGGFTGAYQVRMSHWKLFILGLMLTLATGIIYAVETGGSHADGDAGHRERRALQPDAVRDAGAVPAL